MKITDYLEHAYPLKDRVLAIARNPISLVESRDDLPYDEIRMYDGQLQKVVYLNDEEVMPIVELLSYTKEEITGMKDCELKDVYLAYLDNVEIEPYTLDSIMNSSRKFMEAKRRREELLDNVHHSSS